MKFLIVNADDFGLSSGVNVGITRAHQEGIVSSASLMVGGAAAGEAATWARRHPSLSVGLHFDIGEWACTDGEWRVLYQIVPPRDVDAVIRELEQQLHEFQRLMGRPPTHLDSHQHVHRWESVQAAVLEAAKKLDIPVRHFSTVRYCGDFYGQTGNGAPMHELISVDALLSIFDNLPHGITELACHPAAAADFDSMYRVERLQELTVLCDPRVKAKLVERS